LTATKTPKVTNAAFSTFASRPSLAVLLSPADTSSHFSKSEIAARRRTLRAAESEFLDTIGNLSDRGSFPPFPHLGTSLAPPSPDGRIVGLVHKAMASAVDQNGGEEQEPALLWLHAISSRVRASNSAGVG